jgi:hypothetical protein
LSTQKSFQIERFYFGNLIQGGQPAGKPMVIARSAQVTAEQVQACLKLARVKPPEPHQTTADMPSVLALLHGQNGDHIMVKSQRTPEGYPQLLYLLLPDLAMRWLGGNFSLFESLGYQEMRTYEAPRADLAPLMIDNPQTLGDEEQVNFLYELFASSGDQIKNVEALLAALIHHQPLAIVKAPLSLQKRLGFIQGLLCLLPPPARVGITWATQNDPLTSTPAQINFVNSLDPLPQHLGFDWEAGKLIGEATPDKYSKFIASQLRLDAGLVVEATTNIARTAVWRAMRKESLPQALLFASRRAAIDSAVSNNQPADRETVAAILRQDPTLSEDLRLKYAQHLLAFTLALGDEWQHADVIPVVAAADRSIAETIYESLKKSAEDGKSAPKVLDLLERWLVNVPQASVIPWNHLVHIAAQTQLEALLSEGKVKKAVEFLARLQRANRALQMENAVPQLISQCAPSAAYDAGMAMAIFLLAAEYLPLAAFHQLTADAQLVGQLPQHLRQALFHLQTEARPNPPRNLLVAVAGDLEAQQRMLVVGRLAELAVYLKREELIDTRILEGLLRAAQSGYAWRFGQLIQYLANKYSQPDKLKALDAGALELLPNLYFSMERYDTGIYLLEHYQSVIFGPTRMAAFVDMVGRIFTNTNLSLEALEKIFAMLEHSKIRPEPRTRAYCAVLIAANWGQAYKSLARRLTLMLFNDEKLVEVIGVDYTLQLLNFHLQSKHEVGIQETGDVLLVTAINQGEAGVNLVVKLWGVYQTYPDLAPAAIKMLRRYVRLCDLALAAELPPILEKELGHNLGSVLRATYAMRILLSGRSLVQFTDALDYTTELLMDFASTYHESYPGKEMPPRHRLRQGLDSMSGGLEDRERDLLGAQFEQVAQSIFMLGSRQNRGKQGPDYEKALLQNAALPQTALDFLIYLGGIFARRKRVEMNLNREAMTHVLGNRSAIVLRDQMVVVASFLHDLIAAFPPSKTPPFDLESLNSEIDDLWKQLTLYHQRQTQESLANNTQILAQVIHHMAGRSKEAMFKNPKLKNGQATPENEAEALLWISAYFKRTHQ